MPHYQITMVHNEPQVRRFTENLQFVIHPINGERRVFVRPSGCIHMSQRALDELREEDALHLYYFKDLGGIRAIIETDAVINDSSINKAFAIEDQKLKIIYLADENLVGPVVKLLRDKLPLSKMIDPPT